MSGSTSAIKIIQYVVLPVLAVLGIGLGVQASMRSAATLRPLPAVDEPPLPPYRTFVAGAGLVEASSENIAIGTNVAGVVSAIMVTIGDSVTKGDPLFTIDDRTIRASLATLQASVGVAAVVLANATSEYAYYTQLVKENRAILSKEEIDQRHFTMLLAQAQVALVTAELDAAQVELRRLTVCAPITGRILQLKVHLGEFAAAGVTAQPLLVLGTVDPLNIRTDIDESDAWRIQAAAPAMAFLRGNKSVQSHLRFIRFEPLVIPKVSLTGSVTERIDTRVLQVIYQLTDPGTGIFAGQQMDVYTSTDAGKNSAQ